MLTEEAPKELGGKLTPEAKARADAWLRSEKVQKMMEEDATRILSGFKDPTEDQETELLPWEAPAPEQDHELESLDQWLKENAEEVCQVQMRCRLRASAVTLQDQGRIEKKPPKA